MEIFPSLRNSCPGSTLPTLLVIPSGIGCAFGGYAGDAIPIARLLAAASGCLITHPNVMNGASLYWNDSRIFYVEGYALDHFLAGDILLQPVRQQRIGLLFDAGIESDLRERHLQVADGCRASLGLDVGPVVITDMPLEITLRKCSNGTSWGDLKHPDSLLRAGEALVSSGATVIAVVSRFPDDFGKDALSDYRVNGGVDAFAGAEALISHLLVHHLGIPCANSPAMNPLPLVTPLDPRVAGEELGHTFLTSVLVGLSRAPDLLPSIGCAGKLMDQSSLITAEDIGALVVPDCALGGESTLACLERKIPVIAVRNPSVLKVTKEAFGLFDDSDGLKKMNILPAESYVEAAGLVTLLREGISIESLQRPILSLLKRD